MRVILGLHVYCLTHPHIPNPNTNPNRIQSHTKNIPQLIIQILALIGSSSVDNNFDISSELVTILSLIFTLVSIGLSIAEYFLSKKLFESQLFLIVSFDVNSNDIATMTRKEFESNVLFRRVKFLHSLARSLRLQDGSIDRLKPVQTTNGAVFHVIIDTHGTNFEEVKKTITKQVLAEACGHIFLIAMNDKFPS